MKTKVFHDGFEGHRKRSLQRARSGRKVSDWKQKGSSPSRTRSI